MLADERPLDEERKSVRFDLEKEVDIKFTYSGSEDEWDSGSEEQNPPISATTTVDRQSTGSETAWKTTARSFDEDNKVDVEETNVRKSTLFTKLQPLPKSSKIVGKRFVVRNVSESEHRTQMNANETSSIKVEEIEQNVQNSSNKFENIKNIDVISKSETESSITRNTDSTSVPEKTWKTTVRLRKNSVNGSFDLARIERELESSHRPGKSKLEHSRSFEDTKMNLTKEHEKEMEALKKEFEEKLEQARKEFEENLRVKKESLRRNFEEKLIELKREMAEKVTIICFNVIHTRKLIYIEGLLTCTAFSYKTVHVRLIFVLLFCAYCINIIKDQIFHFFQEEQEIQKLIAGMDESRAENLKKVREELEVCYEKERLEILTSLKTELNERKRELLELRNQEMEKLESEHERDLGEEKLAKLNEFELNTQQSERIEALKKELDKEFDDVRTELRMQQREKITKLTEEHDKCLAEILRDFRIDVST